MMKFSVSLDLLEIDANDIPIRFANSYTVQARRHNIRVLATWK
jgi:hypothetical protein